MQFGYWSFHVHHELELGFLDVVFGCFLVRGGFSDNMVFCMYFASFPSVLYFVKSTNGRLWPAKSRYLLRFRLSLAQSSSSFVSSRSSFSFYYYRLIAASHSVPHQCRNLSGSVAHQIWQFLPCCVCFIGMVQKPFFVIDCRTGVTVFPVGIMHFVALPVFFFRGCFSSPDKIHCFSGTSMVKVFYPFSHFRYLLSIDLSNFKVLIQDCPMLLFRFVRFRSRVFRYRMFHSNVIGPFSAQFCFWNHSSFFRLWFCLCFFVREQLSIFEV